MIRVQVTAIIDIEEFPARAFDDAGGDISLMAAGCALQPELPAGMVYAERTASLVGIFTGESASRPPQEPT